MRNGVKQVLHRRPLAILLGLLMTAVLIWAQAETGQITGTVHDASGAAVPKATITAKNTATGAIRATTGTDEGTYLIPSVSPGEYEVTITAQGFSAYKQKINVAVASPATVDAKLTVGTATTMVEVAENAVTVNTETQSITNVVSTQQVAELPSLTRNPYDFVATMPNVSPTDPSGRGVGYSINGMRAAGTNVLLDGVANNDEFTGSVGQSIPLDSVQEYSVTTSSFTAEQGRADAGVVNVLTKSGTNTFHGSLYEFNRVSALGSNSFYDNAYGLPKGIYDRNQFGYSIGGPVIKNKLFFFQNTEWIRVRSGANEVFCVPTSQFIASAAPATQQFFSTYGTLRSGLTSLGSCSNSGFQKVSYTAPADAGGGSPQNTYELVGRVDYAASEKTQFYVRYALYNEDDFPGTVETSPYKGYDTGQTNVDNAITASGTHTFSPTLVSQTKLNYNRLNNLQPLGSAPIGPTLYMNASATTTLSGTPIAFPGYNALTPGSAIPFGGPQNFATVNEDVSKVWGKHDLRFGGQFVYFQDNRAFGAYEEAVAALGTTTAKSLANFQSGQLYEFEAAINPQGQFPGQSVTLPVGPPDFTRSNRYKEGALYAQDSWKVKPHLTINLGLRWEYYGVQHNNNPNLDSNYYYGSGSNVFQEIRNGNVFTAPKSPIGELWKPSDANFAPRVGFAWDITGDGKTSLRGGYGIGYERNFGNVTFNVIQNPPNYAVVALIAGTDLPTIPISTSNAGPLAGSSGSKVLPGVSLRWVDPNIKQAYAHTYSVSLEHQFAPAILASVSFSGSAGENLYSILAANKVGAGNAYLGDPCTPGVDGDPGTCTSRLRTTQYTSINERTNGGISNYNALIGHLVFRNLSKYGLTMDANYTWAHAIDNLSGTFSDGNQGNYLLGFMDPFAPMMDRGNADFDVRSRVAISAVWQIPVFRGHSTMDKILGGWELAPIFTARSNSNPITLYDCTNAYNYCPRAFIDGQVPTSGVTNVMSNANVYGPDNYTFYNFSNLKINNWFNPKFGISDFGPFPSDLIGRNTIRTPGSWNLDAGVYKNTRITERFTLQLRLEAYNMFNHANFQVYGADVDVSSYNFVDGYFNGNRNVQLGAKILF
jgi:hypothetical protein